MDSEGEQQQEEGSPISTQASNGEQQPERERQPEGERQPDSQQKSTRDEEADQQLLEEAFMYKTQNIYPDGVGESRKRIIRKKAAKFVVENGELKYKMKKKGKVYISIYCFYYRQFVCIVCTV